jgi:succinylarginine dihydrolase
MNQTGYEINFDGIIGPSHNFGGLSFGNVASMENAKKTSSPKKAALQGLEKMKLLSDIGIRQAVLPPHERPHLRTLKALGFTGADRNIPGKAYKIAPELLCQLSSAAAMWVANAATVTPSVDSMDNRVHFTPANLCTMFHRSMESETTSNILKAIFPDPIYFAHHSPLPTGEFFPDEGAANVLRFCKEPVGTGINLFVFGKFTTRPNTNLPTNFPPRQSFEASETIIRSHQLNQDRVIIAQQNPESIDMGVFHNDVISVNNRHLFLFHSKAFLYQEAVLEQIRLKLEHFSDVSPIFIEVPEDKIPIGMAVQTYLFNSQIVTKPDGMMTLICPLECQKYVEVMHFLNELETDPANPIEGIHYVDLGESMQNGGGPACLRNRIILNQNELLATNPSVFLDDKLYKRLVDWINKHYRDELRIEDLADPQLVDEGQSALHEISRILKLGNIYDFQR